MVLFKSLGTVSYSHFKVNGRILYRFRDTVIYWSKSQFLYPHCTRCPVTILP